MHKDTPPRWSWRARGWRLGRARLASVARLVAVAAAAASAACGELQREGGGSSFLLVNALEAAPGTSPSAFAGTLSSDVLTVVNDVPTIVSDLARVRLTLALKDPGPAAAPFTPSSANFITITRYRVRYIRADGRNTEGVDVPFGFDGAVTVTVGTSEIAAAFTLVRHLAKDEAPLKALARNGLIISTIAEVTFYGHDQTGRDVSAVARLSVDFGNFADPSSAS